MGYLDNIQTALKPMKKSEKIVSFVSNFFLKMIKLYTYNLKKN